MPRFAANLSMMYQEHAFLERFGAAAADGFAGVEFLFPYAFDPVEIRARLDAHGLTQALFNLSPGNAQAGERGLASLPGRQDEFKRSVDQALHYARIIGNRNLHVMAGVLGAHEDRAQHRAVYLENLAYAAKTLSSAGLDVLIEPINTRDSPGYFLNTQAEAHAICKEVGAPNLKVQLDLYHAQIVEGDLATKLRHYLVPGGRVGHMQMAGVPLRHEPSEGEVNYAYLFDLIDELGYAGWIGAEYRPRGNTSAGLGWFTGYRAADLKPQ